MDVMIMKINLLVFLIVRYKSIEMRSLQILLINGIIMSILLSQVECQGKEVPTDNVTIILYMLIFSYI